MATELPKAYDPKETEPRIYQAWSDTGFFNPDKLPGRRPEHFSIAMPPSNTTGVLHIGHAMGMTIQDMMTRFERMRQKRALWLPGTDHAAIATQNVVEKELKKKGLRKEDLGRKRFLAQVDEYVARSKKRITEQVRRLGASCDWSRERFTLDAGLSNAVTAAFQTFYDDGLIYRGNRIVNWCPRCQSTLADDEVEYQEKKTPFYYFKYGPVVIGTARPETKFGDKVIVVHPDDKRYAKLVGTSFEVEWILGPITARVIADPVVDPELGTGAMTITPGHSFEDFALAQKYHLPVEKIIDENGRLTGAAGVMQGLSVKEARRKVVEILDGKGLIDHIDENYVHNLSVCYRCGTPVEPLVSKQWFLAVDRATKRLGGQTLKERTLQVIERNEVRFVPDRFAKIYRHWMDHLHDWCISRQIWYGHRIPVWYCVKCSQPNTDPRIQSHWYFVRHGETDWNAEEKLMGHEDIPLNARGRQQATVLAERLSGKSIDLIISSDLKRAKETAGILQKILNIKELDFDQRLRELHTGKATGLTYKEVEKKFGSIYKYDFHPDDGEAYADLEKRAWDAVREHHQQHKHKNILFVSHGGTIQVLLNALREKDPNWSFEHPGLNNSGHLQFEQGEPCENCGGRLYERDSDTLDTWFSSGLWTFSTLGWPQETKDLKAFHPTSVMETSYDIIFFWVARMILMSTYLVGEIPFRTVYLHGLVRDKQGRKMSKSLGNGIDPLEMADKYGADAVRLALVIGTTPGNDQKLDEQKIASYRNYVNKIWNIGRFIAMQSAGKELGEPQATTLADRWLVSQTNRLIGGITRHLEEYEFSQAGEKIYDFAWHELADWYLEIAKLEGNVALARATYKTVLRLLHPFMPFVTEELWTRLQYAESPLMIEAWPAADPAMIDEKADAEFTALKERVIEYRRQRQEQKVPAGQPMGVKKPKNLAAEHIAIVERLGRLKFIDQ